SQTSPHDSSPLLPPASPMPPSTSFFSRSIIPPPPTFTLFPYTTLFRSLNSFLHTLPYQFFSWIRNSRGSCICNTCYRSTCFHLLHQILGFIIFIKFMITRHWCCNIKMIQ